MPGAMRTLTSTTSKRGGYSGKKKGGRSGTAAHHEPIAVSVDNDVVEEAEEDALDVSDEDLAFFSKRGKSAKFLTQLDARKLELPTAEASVSLEGPPKKKLKGNATADPESYYEELVRKSGGRDGEAGSGAGSFSVDPVDALPIKTLEGQLMYRRSQGPISVPSSIEERRALIRAKKAKGSLEETDLQPEGEIVVEGKKPSKQERRQMKKAERKSDREEENVAAAAARAQDLREIEEEVSDEERRKKMQGRMAELALALMANPEGHLAHLKELQEMCSDDDVAVASLAALSLTAVFKDILPGYRVRLPTEKELQMPVSKEVRELRDFEAALLRAYQVYVQHLVRAAKMPPLRSVAVRCMGRLLAAVPHFNFREALLAAVVPRMDAADDEISRLCCSALEEVFEGEGKHGGDATVEAVQLIADLVRQRRCRLRPQVIQVFLKLTFDEELERGGGEDGKGKKGGVGGGVGMRRGEEASETLKSKRAKKAEKRKLASRVHKEVEADFREASAVASPEQRRRNQSLILAAIFETYFRVLKESLLPAQGLADGSGAVGLGTRPLLSSSLEGLARFSHLISLEFMADILAVLRQLGGAGPASESGEGAAEGGGGGSGGEGGGWIELSVEERLRCCIVAFRIVRSNLDALTVDLREFYTQLYRLLLEAPLVASGEEALAEALQVMLAEGRHTDLQRCAAFIRRLTAAALQMDTARAMAGLVVVRHLLQKHSRCRNLLESDPGGGALAGVTAVYTPDATDPEASGALSSVLWDLTLLSTHFHPAVCKLAKEIGVLASSSAPRTTLLMMTPAMAVSSYSTRQGGFRPAIPVPSAGGGGRSRGKKAVISGVMTPGFEAVVREGLEGVGEGEAGKESEGELRQTEGSFRKYFREMREFREQGRLRREERRVRRVSAVMEDYRARRIREGGDGERGKLSEGGWGKGREGKRNLGL